MATFEALRDKVAPAVVVDVLNGTAFEAYGKQYEFGFYVIRNWVDPAVVAKWQGDSHEMFRGMEYAHGANAVKVNGRRCRYSTVQAVTDECLSVGYSTVGYSGTAMRPVVNLLDPKCGVLWEVLQWVHGKIGNPVQGDKLWFNQVVAIRYATGTEYMPWHTDASVLVGRDPMMLSVSVGPAPGALCFAPMRGTEFGRQSAAELGEEVRGMLPLFPGDVYIVCGSFQENFVHKTLQNAAITLPVIQSYPAVNTSIAPSVEKLLGDLADGVEGPRVVITFSRAVLHTPAM